MNIERLLLSSSGMNKCKNELKVLFTPCEEIFHFNSFNSFLESFLFYYINDTNLHIRKNYQFFMYYTKEFLEKEKACGEPSSHGSLQKVPSNFETAPSKRYLDISQNQLKRLTGFSTGHYRLKTHVCRMCISDTDEQRFFPEEE